LLAKGNYKNDIWLLTATAAGVGAIGWAKLVWARRNDAPQC